MSTINIQSLVEAGVHFGHRASRWHPSMERFIYGKHNQIHIIDLRETVRGLIRGQHFLAALVEAGHEVVFIGTKPQAREVVREQAGRCNMHFVVNRWLGGTLTNFNTIRSRLKRLEELEAMEADGSINIRSKKEISRLRRERRKIHRNLEGIRKMNKHPGALVVVDTRRDHIAVAEARLLGIPVIAICDTDTDPRKVDLVVPGNDDAYRSIEVILGVLSDAVIAGRDKLTARQAAEEKKRLEDEAAARRKADAKKAEKAAAAPKPPAPKPAAPAAPKPPAAAAPKPAAPKPAAPAGDAKPAADAPAVATPSEGGAKAGE